MVAMAGLLFTLQLGRRPDRRASRPSPARWCACATRAACTHWQRESTTADRQSWYFHWLLTDGTRAKEVRLFGLGELFRGLYRDLRLILRTERIGIARRRAWADFGGGAARGAGHLRHLRLHRLADASPAPSPSAPW